LIATEDYDAEDENWEFKPTTIVECERQIREGNEVLVVVRKVDM